MPFQTAEWHLERVIETTPIKISGTTKDMTMTFLPDVGIYKEAQNQKIDIAGPVCKLQTKDFWKSTSRHANLSKLCWIVTIDVRNEH